SESNSSRVTTSPFFSILVISWRTVLFAHSLAMPSRSTMPRLASASCPRIFLFRLIHEPSDTTREFLGLDYLSSDHNTVVKVGIHITIQGIEDKSSAFWIVEFFAWSAYQVAGMDGH